MLPLNAERVLNLHGRVHVLPLNAERVLHGRVHVLPLNAERVLHGRVHATAECVHGRAPPSQL